MSFPSSDSETSECIVSVNSKTGPGPQPSVRTLASSPEQRPLWVSLRCTQQSQTEDTPSSSSSSSLIDWRGPGRPLQMSATCCEWQIESEITIKQFHIPWHYGGLNFRKTFKKWLPLHNHFRSNAAFHWLILCATFDSDILFICMLQIDSKQERVNF